MTSYEILLNDAIEDIKNNKKVFVFYPYKNKRGDKYPSMQELALKIEEQTNKKGVFYIAVSDDAVVKELIEVNKNWTKYDFIITNTKITVGVNFDQKYFDRVYLFIAGFNSTRDIIQVSRRCRTLNDNLIKCSFMDKHNSNKVFDNDNILVENCLLNLIVVFVLSSQFRCFICCFRFWYESLLYSLRFFLNSGSSFFLLYVSLNFSLYSGSAFKLSFKISLFS